jgi:hypothetical protein
MQCTGKDDSGLLTWPSLVMHNLNFVLIMIDFYLNKVVFIPMHACYLVIFGSIFIVSLWFQYHRYGVWYYFFLDYNSPFALFSYSATLATMAAIFGAATYWTHTYKVVVA